MSRCTRVSAWLKLLLPAIALMGIAAFGARSEERPAANTPAPAHAAPAEPSEYRNSDYRSPTPLTLQGATVVTGAEAMALWKTKGALFVDVLPRPRKPDNLPPETVWHVPEHRDIPGSVWLPNTGFGALAPAATAYFEGQLQRLSQGNLMAPLLFYCLRDCWMSWNAARRAVALGYRHVYWFPDGADGWTETGGTLEPATPAEPAP